MSAATLASRAASAAASLKLRCPAPPSFAWFAEGGVGALETSALAAATVEARRVDGFGPGYEGRFLYIPCAGASILAFEGGSLAAAGADAESAALPVYAFARLGVRTLLVSGGASALEPSLEAPSLMAVEDHVNFAGVSPLRAPIDPELGPPFLDLANAYDRGLLSMAERHAARLGVRLRAGILAVSRGPMLETDAERRFLRAGGAHAVAQSIVSPAIAARHAGLCVLALAEIIEGVRRAGEYTDPGALARAAGLVSRDTAELIQSMAAEIAAHRCEN